jgi:hypothetical protein
MVCWSAKSVMEMATSFRVNEVIMAGRYPFAIDQCTDPAAGAVPAASP